MGYFQIKRFRENRLALVGAIVILIFIITALLSPLIAPYDPNAQNLQMRLLPPSWNHPFGTDKFGRDLLSRVIYGSRVSLTIGFLAVTIALTLGTLIGAVAGFFGGKIDGFLMRMTDVFLAFPRLFLILALVAFFTPSVRLVVIVLGITGWMTTARLIRGEVLSIKERDFVQAARVIGAGTLRIIFRHVLPNALTPVIATLGLRVGDTILTEAALSFLGLSAQPPTPSWGNIIMEGKEHLLDAWWIAFFPGIAILLTVLCFNLISDGIREVLEPQSLKN